MDISLCLPGTTVPLRSVSKNLYGRPDPVGDISVSPMAQRRFFKIYSVKFALKCNKKFTRKSDPDLNSDALECGLLDSGIIYDVIYWIAVIDIIDTLRHHFSGTNPSGMGVFVVFKHKRHIR